MSHARGSHYHLPGNLQARLAALVDYNNRERYHESLDNLTPHDAHFGRGGTILGLRAGINRKTMALSRTLHKKMAA